jgi:hypothetical protein
MESLISMYKQAVPDGAEARMVVRMKLISEEVRILEDSSWPMDIV